MSDSHAIAVQPFGYAIATVTDASHVYLQFDECQIHGVTYRASLHLYRWADGVWRLGQESDPNDYTRHRHACYLSRARTEDHFKDPSSAAWSTLCGRVASAAILAIVKLPSAVFLQAEVEKCEADLERAKEATKKAMDVLMDAQMAEQLAFVALLGAKDAKN